MFEACTNLSDITVDTGNPQYTGEGGILWNKAKIEIVAFPSARGVVPIPEGTMSIGEFAFMGCEDLTGISIPESITSIGKFAFIGCKGLTTITIPKEVKAINDRTFSACTSLTSVTIPVSVTSIGEGVFYNCGNLTSVTIPVGVTAVGGNTFSGWTSSQRINVKGHANRAAADRAWGAEWRGGCNAAIVYGE